VWHTVSLPARKERGDIQGGQSSPAITLFPRTAFERFETQPPVRPSVLFGSDPAREVEMSNDWDKSNVIATDTSLGYQIPRLWFPHAQPGQGGSGWGEGAPASAGVSMPEPRSQAAGGGVDRQIGSDAVVREYQQMQAFRAYSSLAMARPSSAEPLHGSAANAKLVATMGKRPEEEDAAIAQEWSPRGGRKRNRAQQPMPRAGMRQDQRGRGVDSGWDRARSPEVRGRRRGNGISLSNSPGGSRAGSCARRPWRQPKHNHSGHGVPLSFSPGLPRRVGQSGRHHDDAQNYKIATTTAPFDDDDVFSNSSDGQGQAQGYDSDEQLGFGFSPELETLGRGGSSSSGSRLESRQFRGNNASSRGGNLGGQFAMLVSPYRTYRAKHSRLLRARSSERGEAETRRAVLEHREGAGAAVRSRSADSGVRSERWRGGTSGMTSPLLQREGFGLLQSRTTGKVALGMQLPRDQLSATGRARAAAAAIEERFHSSTAEPIKLISARASGQRKKNHPQRDDHHDWHRTLHGDSYFVGMEELADDGSDRPQKRPHDRSGSGYKEGFPIKEGYVPFTRRPLFKADMPSWSYCAPRRGRRCNRSASAGRSRDRKNRRGNQHRAQFSGSRKVGGGFSWSPPRTQIRTKSNYITDFSAPGSSSTANKVGREAEWASCEYGSSWGADVTTSVELSNRRHACGRPLSPLMVPLDPYRGPLTVVRAGTLVSRRDAAEVERASRHAQRKAAEKRPADDEMASSSSSSSSSCSPGRGYHHQGWGESSSTRGGGGGGHRRDRDAWVVAGVVKDANNGRDGVVEIDRMKRLLPSVESMGRELRAIRRADAAMREEQLAQV
ncbi:unnamed protein product, partial [Laminaria digitata]